MQTIEFKWSENLSVYFSPLENSRAHYLVEIHDFSNLDGRKLKCDYLELQEILKNPKSFIGSF